MNIAIPTINATPALFEENLADVCLALRAVDEALNPETAILLHPYALVGAQPFEQANHPLFYQATSHAFRRLSQEYAQPLISLVYKAGQWLVHFSHRGELTELAFGGQRYIKHAGYAITYDHLLNCADMSAFAAKDVKAWVVFRLNPYSKEALEREVEQFEQLQQQNGQPVVVIGGLGCANDVLFAGDLGVFNSQGAWSYHFALENQVTMLELTDELRFTSPITHQMDLLAPLMSRVYEFICFAIKDFVQKSGFKQVHLGLSGGVDSALVAALAVAALGAENVQGFLMPSPHSSEHSISDAKQLAQQLGIRHTTIEIGSSYQHLQQLLGAHFAITQLADENLQARLRGLFLMTYANSSQSLLLTTGNKSEIACGYATLYGDMCGVYNPIGDLYKSDVYALCAYINERSGREIIPKNILTKAPSAELRAGQFDQESLPEYARLDKIIELLLQGRYSYEQVAQLSQTTLEEVSLAGGLLLKSEFKRWQAAPVLKLSDTHFGSGRKINLLSRFKGE